VRAARVSDGRVLVDRLLSLTTADDIEREVRGEMLLRFPGLLGEPEGMIPPPA